MKNLRTVPSFFSSYSTILMCLFFSDARIFGAFLAAVLLDVGVDCLWLTEFAVCLTGGILGGLKWVIFVSLLERRALLRNNIFRMPR